MSNPKNKDRFSLRLPPDVKSALAKAAEREGRSINAQAVHIIRKDVLKQRAA